MPVVSLTRSQADPRRGPGGDVPGTLSEAFTVESVDGGVVGFVASQLADDARPVLWVQDRLSIMETGAPYLPGMGAPFLRAALSRPDEVLAAMEEGLRCVGLAAVVGEIWGAPPALDFTATRRLAMRAEARGVACWLIRRAAVPDASAARNRWRVASLPSAPHPDDPAAPGDPRWRVELFRSRFAPPGVWMARHDRAANRVDFAAAFPDGVLAEEARTDGRGAGR